MCVEFSRVMLVWTVSYIIACTNGEVRLQNVTYSYPNDQTVVQGRVTLCINGSYQPICDVGWDDVDAQVLCNERYGGYRPYGKCFEMTG